MECLLAFHFLSACNLFLQIRLQILQVLSILQLSSILEILLHLQNFFLAQLLTLLSSNRIHSRTDSKHRRQVCRYNAGSRIRIGHNSFQHFPFRPLHICLGFRFRFYLACLQVVYPFLQRCFCYFVELVHADDVVFREDFSRVFG